MNQSPFVESVRAYVRGNAGFYSFDPSLYGILLAAWKGGQAFFTGQSIDDDEITVKLAEVEAVMYCTPASLEAAHARAKAEAQEQDRESFE